MTTTLSPSTEPVATEPEVCDCGQPLATHSPLTKAAAAQQLFEVSCSIAEFGRGERGSPATNDLPIIMRLAEPPEPVELVRSA